MKRSEVEQAERFSRQRAALLPAFAVLLIVQQGAFIAGGGGTGRYAVISGVTWMLMAALMILISATGGWFLAGKPVRDLMNDALGTDQLGRDVLSRLIYGARTSLTVALRCRA